MHLTGMRRKYDAELRSIMQQIQKHFRIQRMLHVCAYSSLTGLLLMCLKVFLLEDVIYFPTGNEEPVRILER